MSMAKGRQASIAGQGAILVEGLARARRWAPLPSSSLTVLILVWAATLVTFSTGAGPVLAADGPHLAFAARIAGDDSRTRIVVEFDRKPTVSLRYLASPPRVVVDLPETAFAFEDSALRPRGLFDDIRYGAMGPGRARIVLGSREPVRVALSDVRKNEDAAGYRLVLDAVAATPEDFEALLAEQAWSGTSEVAKRGDRPTAADLPRRRPFTVVIDPGHGGIDSGARGRGGQLEKEVTLAFAKTFAAALERAAEPIRVILTREDDRFLSLAERVRIARQNEADLFVSIHADSIGQGKIRGASVYTLSDKASDQMAAAVAARENRSDDIAGVSDSRAPQAVADILLDLTRRETQVLSIALARTVVAAFENEIALISNPHRSAGFRVLQAPDVPSVLLELGYLSNREDEKLLADPEWRRQVADLLVRSVERFRTSVLAGGG